MIFKGFSLSKLLKGFAFWNGDKLGKLIFHVIIIAISLFIYYMAIKIPKNVENTTQNAKTITNISNDEGKDAKFLYIRILGLKVEF